jgi:hypothetical protein
VKSAFGKFQIRIMVRRWFLKRRVKIIHKGWDLKRENSSLKIISLKIISGKEGT